MLKYLTDHLVDPLDRSLLFCDWHESGGKIGKEVNQADKSHNGTHISQGLDWSFPSLSDYGS